jgi:polysaccharide export outer membrane protein
MRKPLVLLFAVATLAPLGLGGCVSAGIGPASVRAANTQPPREPLDRLPAKPIDGPPVYRVGPMDVVAIDVFREQDLTREVRVEENGEISLPLVGRVQAAGKTTAELERDIAMRLQVAMLENPSVSVRVKEFMSQRVTVEGAVSQPGVYPLTSRTSLLQMIATAHGLDEMANPGACVVFRVVDGQRYAAAFDIRQIRAGRMVDPELLGGDTVVVDYSGIRANYRDFLSLYPLFSVFLRGY